MRHLKIVSDGTVYGTAVYNGDARLEGITKIVIEPINGRDSDVRATVEFENVQLEMSVKNDQMELFC